MKKTTEGWGTRIGLILAMAGNAVGFGNFLRFPVQAIQNGGGAFIIPYLVSFLLLGIPLLLIEWSIGRYGGQYGFHSTPFMFQSMNRLSFWKYVGIFGIFSNIGIGAYYTYMESWTLAYIFHSLIGTFKGLDQHGVVEVFNHYVSLDKFTFFPFESLFFFVFCLFLNVYILSRGLCGGVEKVAMFAMPMLILFGFFLAFKAITIQAGVDGAVENGIAGLNFLWTPHFDSIWNPKVWFAAASQIFFTLSLGMGSIQAYASYLRKNDDIALNAMTAGWTNEFVEVVLGGAIVIPISIGFLGLDKVFEITQLGGLGLGFKTLPFLFYQWGDVMGTIVSIVWFTLLFFAGITSSLAMGVPVQAFMKDEFGLSTRSSAYLFGGIILVLGMPTVLFFNEGVFDEYDYWTGSFTLFIFAAFEAVLFAWFFGYKRGWEEIIRGAEIKIPGIYKYIIGFVTPIILIIILIGAIFKPMDNNWVLAFQQLFSGEGWPFAFDSLVGKMMNLELHHELQQASDANMIADIKRRIWLINASRIILLVTFVAIGYLVYRAFKKRKKENRWIS
ncbi:MAG: sodium-dependent transporter [Bacteroidales bacterium]|nr:sodium-dependent transporter [Bacteroidales bacterium]